jgi:hypothetical protein
LNDKEILNFFIAPGNCQNQVCSIFDEYADNPVSLCSSDFKELTNLLETEETEFLIDWKALPFESDENHEFSTRFECV